MPSGKWNKYCFFTLSPTTFLLCFLSLLLKLIYATLCVKVLILYIAMNWRICYQQFSFSLDTNTNSRNTSKINLNVLHIFVCNFYRSVCRVENGSSTGVYWILTGSLVGCASVRSSPWTLPPVVVAPLLLWVLYWTRFVLDAYRLLLCYSAFLIQYGYIYHYEPTSSQLSGSPDLLKAKKNVSKCRSRVTRMTDLFI